MERTNQRFVPLVIIALAAVLLAARVASHVMKPEAKSDSLVAWMTIEEGTRLARASNRPILYDFTADWCGPCHTLDKEVFRDPVMAAEINRRFVPIRVTDRQQEDGANPPAVAELQRKYGVNGFPTIVIAGANGDERARMEGFRGRDVFQRTMEQVR